MIPLSKTQIEILTNAANRESLSIEPLPSNVNKGIAPRVINSLLIKDLIDKKNESYIINTNGFKAIGITPKNKRSKNTLLIGLMSAAEGASIEDLCQATGWQNHSVRGAISTLKSKGHSIVSSKEKGESRIYKIQRKEDPMNK